MTPVERLVRLVEQVSGNVLGTCDAARFERLARERVAATGHTNLTAYVRWLEADRGSGEWRHLLSLITVNESYLFRGHQHFRALSEVLLPEFVDGRTERRFRVWSAGCARGEEAASLAIVLAECPGLVGWDWSILASDVDESALEEARTGVYGSRAVAKVPAELLARHFDRLADNGFRLHRALLDRIDYRSLNLADPRDLPLHETFDLVFLRNVLIYFRPETQRRVILTVSELLAVDGYLFLGPSESLWQLDTGLQTRDLGDCFCYRRPVPGLASPPTRPVPVPAGWSEAAGPPVSPAHRAPTSVPDEGELGAEVVEALVAGRLDGEAGAAELAARAVDRFADSAPLRALEGLAAEMRGAFDAARGSYRAALYLDPALVQVRLLLAHRLEQDGRRERASTELRTILETMLRGQPHLLPGWRELGLADPTDLERRCRDLLR